MVVTPQMESGENVEMPSIFFPDDDPKGMDPIELTLTVSGRFLIEKQEYPKDGLEDTLTQLHALSPNRRLVLKGDRELSYQNVREIFAIAEKVGFPGVALKVGRKDGDPRQNIDNTGSPAAPEQG
jgi:biopolymer transport protein ExbD